MRVGVQILHGARLKPRPIGFSTWHSRPFICWHLPGMSLSLHCLLKICPVPQTPLPGCLGTLSPSHTDHSLFFLAHSGYEMLGYPPSQFQVHGFLVYHRTLCPTSWPWGCTSASPTRLSAPSLFLAQSLAHSRCPGKV